jgi:hypothetical protein
MFRSVCKVTHNYLIPDKNIRIYVQHNHIITIFVDYGTNQERQ